MKLLFSTILFLIITTCKSQTWKNVGNGVNDNVYDMIKFDNKLYACGRIGVMTWDGTIWSRLPYPFGIAYPLSIAAYNDTIYVAGDYPWSGTVSNVYKFDGSNWVQVGGDFNGATWTSTKQLLNYNGHLISGGRYSLVNGKRINNIASWNGQSWDSLGAGLNGSVYNLAVYKDELIAAGDFSASGNDTLVNKIAKWNGVNWSPLDTLQRINSGGPMIEYNGDLIIGNIWDKLSGANMQGIARWDGVRFTSIGNYIIKNVSDFWIFNNDLYLSGTLYSLNPSKDDNVVLKWNGYMWQQVGQNFDQRVLTIEDFNGQLFCAGFFGKCGTTSTPYISKLNLTSSIYDKEYKSNLKVFPNPSFGEITFETDDNGDISIIDLLGKEVYKSSISTSASTIKTDMFDPGVYILNFKTEMTNTSVKLYIQ